MSYAVGAALYNKILQLIILPTEKCNFRCTYCYEDFEIGRMSPQTVEAVKKLIAARVTKTGLEQLTLSWFGGEPMLAKDIIFDISEYAKTFVDDGRLKHFGGDLTTNGYLLTVDNLRRLAAAHQNSFQISLDGYGAGHDETRKYINGKGTFERIWSNLNKAAETDIDFRITLRCHQTHKNADSMSRLIEEIKNRFGEDKRFNVFFKSIENLGGANSKNIAKLDKESIASRVIKLEEVLSQTALQTSSVIDGPESATGTSVAVGVGSKLIQAEKKSQEENGTKTIANFEGYICYAAKPNSLMIRADATIGKCTVLMDDPRNRVGQLNPDGTVQLDAEMISSVWMRGFKSVKEMELGCPAQGLSKLKPAEKPLEFVKIKALATAVA